MEDATAVRQRLQNALRSVRRHLTKVRKTKRGLGEEATKKAFIDPVLAALGWDMYGPYEVRLEYKHDRKSNPVDYALFKQDAPAILVEAKALDVNLDDVKWQAQVISYASVAGVKWCLLTDGDLYCMYNLFAPGGIADKLFRTVTVSQENDREHVLDLLQLMAKEGFPDLIDRCWQTDRVDQRVGEALREMLAGQDTKLVNAIRARVGDLKPAEIREALDRADVVISFPPLEVEAPTPAEPAMPTQATEDEETPWGPRSYRGPLRLDGNTLLLSKWRPFEKELREERVSMEQVAKTAGAARALADAGEPVSLPGIRKHPLGPSSQNPTQRAMGALCLAGSLRFVKSGHTDHFEIPDDLTVEAMLDRVRSTAEPVSVDPGGAGQGQVFKWTLDIRADGSFTLHCAYRPDSSRNFSVGGRKILPSADFKPARTKLVNEIFERIKPLFPDVPTTRVRAKAWSGVHKVYPSREYGGK